MRTPTTLLLVLLAAAGCGSDSGAPPEPALTDAERQALAETATGAAELHGGTAELAFAGCTGLLDLDGLDYTPPSEENGWVGTIAGDDFRWRGAVGDLLVTFTVAGDDGPVDPYATDLSDDVLVTVEAKVSFEGTDARGSEVSLVGDFTLVREAGEGGGATFSLDGSFDVVRGEFAASLVAEDFAVTFDGTSRRAVSVTGTLSGTIDLPRRAPDAHFTVVGEGDFVTITASVGATTIEITIDLDGPDA